MYAVQKIILNYSFVGTAVFHLLPMTLQRLNHGKGLGKIITSSRFSEMKPLTYRSSSESADVNPENTSTN